MTKKVGDHVVYKPDDKTRGIVEMLVACGVTQEEIAKLIGISSDTLQKYYRKELDLGKPKANAKIARRLFEKAAEGDNACMFFWLKTQARWKEAQAGDTPQDPIHSVVKTELTATLTPADAYLKMVRGE